MADPFTLQEAFDTAYLGVLRQGRPSRSSPGSSGPKCLYRGPDGLKCAMGFLIDDETARKNEGRGAYRIAHVLGWSTRLCDLADCLQTAHDKASVGGSFLPLFKDRAVLVAEQFGLTVPPDPAP